MGIISMKEGSDDDKRDKTVKWLTPDVSEHLIESNVSSMSNTVSVNSNEEIKLSTNNHNKNTRKVYVLSKMKVT